MYRNGYVGLLFMNLLLLLNPWSSWKFSQPNSFLYVQRCSVKKVFLKKFHKIHMKTPAPGSLFLMKLQAEACNFI